MNAIIDNLSATKRLLLERRLRGAMSPKQVGAELVPLAAFARPAGDEVPSYTQERYLALGNRAPESVQHGRILRFRGPVSAERLAGAMMEIVDRHEILRTRYPLVDGRRIQEVLPTFSLTLTCEKLEATSPTDADKRLRELAEHVQPTKMDPVVAPPYQVRLFNLGTDDHAIVWYANHILYDDWSSQLLFKEFLARYHGQNLPAISRQHRDYAAWWRQLMCSSMGDGLRDYWRQNLADCRPRLQLHGRPNPEDGAWPAGEERILINSELAGKLVRIAGREQSTLFVVILDALAQSLAAWSGQQDIVVGTTVADRSDPATHLIMGPLINWVPIRLLMSSHKKGEVGREQTRKTVFDALTHHYCPLAEMGLPVTDAEQPYNVKLTVRHAQQSVSAGDGLRCESINIRDTTTRYDLEFFLDLPSNPTTQGACFRCVYNAATLAAETIQELLVETVDRLYACAALKPARRSMEVVS